MGAEGTLHVMNGIGTGAGIFAISGALFVATSLVSLGSRKKRIQILASDAEMPEM